MSSIRQQVSDRLLAQEETLRKLGLGVADHESLRDTALLLDIAKCLRAILKELRTRK